jgi:hypothetical protein
MLREVSKIALEFSRYSLHIQELKMSLAETKKELEKALNDIGSRVISLSGKWGTGKTYLWSKVKEASEQDIVKKALEVSLFGLESIAALKSRLYVKAISSYATKTNENLKAKSAFLELVKKVESLSL